MKGLTIPPRIIVRLEVAPVESHDNITVLSSSLTPAKNVLVLYKEEEELIHLTLGPYRKEILSQSPTTGQNVRGNLSKRVINNNQNMF